MHLQTYMHRIGCTIEKPSLTHLQNLQQFHLKTVPFENLDVIRHTPIYLSLPSMYEKIVTNNRGGYCYELNGLFHWALNELGYVAQIVAATVIRPDGTFAKKNTHVAIIVNINGQKYLTDVGFGNAQYAPIPLDSTIHQDVSGTYRVIHMHENVYRLCKKQEGAWRPVYEFTTSERALIDFHEGCVFNQVSHDSPFTQTDLATIATTDGRVTLSDHEVTTTKDGNTSTWQLTTEEKTDVLKRVFGIRL